MKQKVIVVLGPTASGKTKTSIAIAQKFNGVIISADSMQIYKNMNIGTAKPTKDEMCGIEHKMMDIVTPFEQYSVAQWVDSANNEIENILSVGKTPIIVGGTGLYLSTLINNIQLTPMEKDLQYREYLQSIVNGKGAEDLHQMLCEIDSESGERLHVNDTKRVMRALEVYKTTGQTIGHWAKKSKSIPSPYDFYVIGLKYNDRQKLYKAIDNRVDEMLKMGLLDEVKSLLESGLDETYTSMQAIGYKELEGYFKGKTTLEDAALSIKQESRRYAKRQMTWFNKMDDINWHNVDEYTHFEQCIEKICSELQNGAVI